MERPLAVTGFAYLSALAVALFVGTEYCITLAVIFIVSFVVSLFSKTLRKKAVIPAVLLTSAIAVTMLLGYSNAKVKPIESLKGETAEITAQICDLPYSQNNRCYYYLELLSVKNRKIPSGTKIMISSKTPLKAEPYDKVEAKVQFYTDGSDTYKAYNISRNIMLRGSFDTKVSPTVTHTKQKPLYYYTLMIRQTVTNTVSDILPSEQAGFVNALLTGDKTGITDEQKNTFRASGISHIIVVSGFHLSVLSQIMMTVLCFLMRKRKRSAALICSVFVFVYMAIVGFSPSVVRAGIMQIIFLFGTACTKNADSLNSLAISAFLICLMNPYAAGDVGFLLSFTATLGIILLSDKINVCLRERTLPLDNLSEREQIQFRERIKPFVYGVISVTAVTVSASVFTMPIMILYFKQLAVYAVLSNLMISFAVSVLIVCAMIMVFLHISIVLSFLVLPFAVICGILTNYILWTAELISSLPFSTVTVSQMFVPFWLALMILIGAFLLMFPNRKRAVRYYALVAVLTLIVGFVSDNIVKYNSVKLAVLDTGEGLSVVMTENNQISVLYCGGNYERSYVMTDYLQNSAAENINLLVLMDKSQENSRYAETILQKYPVETIEAYDEEVQYESVHSLIQTSGHIILPSSGTQPLNTFYTANTEITTCQKNDCHSVMIKSHGRKILICSDGTDCLNLPEEFLKCDVLIVNGTVKNAELLKTKRVIISDIKDNLENYASYLQKFNRHIYATAEKGNLALRIYQDGQFSLRRENGWLS